MDSRMCWFVTAALLWTAIGGCRSVATQGDVDQLSKEVAVLEKKRDDRRAELRQLLEETKTQECRATRAKVEAKVIVRRVECVKEQAKYESCIAKNQARTSGSGFLGCLLGLGAAALTGGAATPYAVAGCAGGIVAGGVTEKKCGSPPACVKTFNVIEKEVLQQEGLESISTCE